MKEKSFSENTKFYQLSCANFMNFSLNVEDVSAYRSILF